MATTAGETEQLLPRVGCVGIPNRPGVPGARCRGSSSGFFVKHQVPRLGRIFLPNLLDSETEGGESVTLTALCFGKFEKGSKNCLP